MSIVRKVYFFRTMFTVKYKGEQATNQTDCNILVVSRKPNAKFTVYYSVVKRR